MSETRPVVLIAHSLAVSAVVHTAQNIKDAKVRGAFLVSPPDLENDDIVAELPHEVRTFRNVPRDPLIPGDTAGLNTLTFRLKGSDLADFRAGRLAGTLPSTA